MFRYATLPFIAVMFLLCTCASAQATENEAVATSFPAQAEWLEKWENSLAYTLEALALVKEEDLDYRPTEDQMTLREQFNHMAGNIYFLAGKYVWTPPGFKLDDKFEALNNAADGKELAITLQEAYAFGADAVSHLSEEEWGQTAPGFFIDGKSRRTVIYLLQDHATHHRA